MTFQPLLQHRQIPILFLIVFGVAFVLFSGHHAANVMDGKGFSHQSDAYFCLFAMCIAVLGALTYLTIFAHTSAIPDTVSVPVTGTLPPPDKPPRMGKSGCQGSIAQSLQTVRK